MRELSAVLFLVETRRESQRRLFPGRGVFEKLMGKAGSEMRIWRQQIEAGRELRSRHLSWSVVCRGVGTRSEVRGAGSSSYARWESN